MKNSARPSLVRNTVYTGLGRVASLIAGFCLSPFILVKLGDRAFGYWVLAFAVGHHLSVFLNFGAGHALIYRIAQLRAQEDHDAVYRALGGYLLISTVCCLPTFLILIGLTPLFAPWLGLKSSFLWFGGHDFGLELILCAAAAVFLRPFTLAWDLILQGCERFDDSGKLAIVRALLWTMTVLVLLQNGLGARGLLLGEALLLILLSIPGTYLAWRSLPGRPRICWPEKSELKSQLQYGFGIYVSLVTDLLNSQSDKLILGGSLSVVTVKAYELGQKITLPGRLALTMLGQVVVPSVPNVLANRGEEGVKKLHAVGQKVMVLVSSFFFAFLMSSAPSFLRAWLGPSAVDGQTIDSLRFLALACFLSLLTELSVQIARGLGRLSTEIKASLVFSLLGLIVRASMLSIWGLRGLLMGTVLTTFLTSLYLLKGFTKVIGYELWSHLRESTLRPVLVAIMAGLSVYTLESMMVLPVTRSFLGSRTPHLLRLCCDGLCFSVVASLASCFFAIIDDDMKAILRQLKQLMTSFRGN
jgi:O-antigen/teichoic acid export membrane protein